MARLQGSPREGPVPARKPPFHSPRVIGFAAHFETSGSVACDPVAARAANLLGAEKPEQPRFTSPIFCRKRPWALKAS